MPFLARPITDRATWLEWRRQCVTASRVCQLPAFDCSPFKECTPLRLYAELRGVEFPDRDDNKILRRGRWLEPSIGLACSELRPEWTITPAKEFLTDGALGATPDFYVDGDPRGRAVLQAKSVAPSVYAKEWQGGKEIPFWIVLQTLTECMLSDAAFGVVAALLVDAYAMDCAILEVPRHPAAEAKIRAEAERFMADVRNMVEPDPDFSRDGSMLKLLLPKEQPGKALDLIGNNAMAEKLAARAELCQRIKNDKIAIEAIENELKFMMQDAERIDGLPGWRATFKTTHYKGYTVEPRDIRVLRIQDKRPPEERPGGDNDSDEN